MARRGGGGAGAGGERAGGRAPGRCGPRDRLEPRPLPPRSRLTQAKPGREGAKKRDKVGFSHVAGVQPLRSWSRGMEPLTSFRDLDHVTVANAEASLAT